MTDTAISPLRQRMIEDMTVRGFTPGTQLGDLDERGGVGAALFLRRDAGPW